MNISNLQIELKLKSLKRNKKYVALSLHPAVGDSTISRFNNRLYINEGRDGMWTGIPEVFYDYLVNKYDSRCKK